MNNEDPLSKTQSGIIRQCDKIKALLLEKNRKYNDSAVHPVRVFSKADRLEQLRVRIDDKLSRIKHGDLAEDEDVLLDCVGYLVLLLVAKEDDDGSHDKV